MGFYQFILLPFPVQEKYQDPLPAHISVSLNIERFRSLKHRVLALSEYDTLNLFYCLAEGGFQQRAE